MVNVSRRGRIGRSGDTRVLELSGSNGSEKLNHSKLMSSSTAGLFCCIVLAELNHPEREIPCYLWSSVVQGCVRVEGEGVCPGGEERGDV